MQTIASLTSAIQNPNGAVPVTVDNSVVARTKVKPKDNTSITRTSYFEKPKNFMKMPMFDSNDSFDDFILHFESIIDRYNLHGEEGSLASTGSYTYQCFEDVCHIGSGGSK